MRCVVMNNSGNLMRGIWFGNYPEPEMNLHIKQDINTASNERNKILAINEALKFGDFSVKPFLFELLNTSKDENVLNLCVRLFTSTASHQDLIDSNNLRFLSWATDNTIQTFVSCSRGTLSIHIIPYLFTLLEEWDDTDVCISIRDALDGFMDFYDEIGENAGIKKIKKFCISKIKSTDPNMYYYEGSLSFPGELTKNLAQKAIVSLQSGQAIKTNIVPSLLSIWSGKKCPVEYDTVVTDDIYQQILRYIDSLAEMTWERGHKYFYGHEIK